MPVLVTGCGNLVLTHPLGVVVVGSFQQITAAGRGPRSGIPVGPRVSCDDHAGLLGFCPSRGTSVRCCCYPAVEPGACAAVGPGLQREGGYGRGGAR